WVLGSDLGCSGLTLGARVWLRCGTASGSGRSGGRGEGAQDAGDRDVDPGGAVVLLVAQLVEGLLELAGCEQRLAGHALRGEQRVVDRVRVAAQERCACVSLTVRGAWRSLC